MNKHQILVSNKDRDLLKKYKWYIVKSRNTFYAVNCEGKRLHRIILERMVGHKLLKMGLTDHVDMNGLNCKRNNLRISSHSQNGANSISRKNSLSRYLGVTKQSKKHKTWIARIQHLGKKIYLGSFKEEKDAAVAYNIAAKKYHGKFANINILAR